MTYRAGGYALRFAAAALCLTATLSGCFLRKYVYRPTLVANAIGDSTTTFSDTRVHVYRGDEYEIYGPTALSVSVAEQQMNRAYREFSKHFGVEGPPMVLVVADSAFAISPGDAGLFAKRRIHTFVYVRPHSLRDIEGVAPDTPEDEIWPVSSRVARELLTAYISARRHLPPAIETTTHAGDYHTDPLPIWFVDAVVALLSDPGAPDRIMDYLKDHLGDAPPVATLLDMRPPNAGVVDTIAASREQRTIIGAEGVGLTLFLVEREGPRVVGRLADAFLAGRTTRDVINDARHVPQNDKEFERVWRNWVRDEYGR
ncbi:MAG TPA: hypothetical protein VGH98_12980 [Gemmatimonadaceae bacterium]|jgi:hypothetical protein